MTPFFHNGTTASRYGDTSSCGITLVSIRPIGISNSGNYLTFNNSHILNNSNASTSVNIELAVARGSVRVNFVIASPEHDGYVRDDK